MNAPLEESRLSCALVCLLLFLLPQEHHCIHLEVLILINHNIESPQSIEKVQAEKRNCKSLLFLLVRGLTLCLNSLALLYMDVAQIQPLHL